MKGPKPTTAIVRFVRKVNPEDGCLVWMGRRNYGYGSFSCGSIRRKTYRAHRFAYEMFRGPIPEGMVLDHLCRNKACVDPWHLEAVTREENLRRGLPSPSDINAAKTHCIKGHPFNEANTYFRPKDGSRTCKKCKADWERENNDRR